MTLNHKIYELLSKNPNLTSTELGAMAKCTASNAKVIKFRLQQSGYIDYPKGGHPVTILRPYNGCPIEARSRRQKISNEVITYLMDDFRAAESGRTVSRLPIIFVYGCAEVKENTYDDNRC